MSNVTRAAASVLLWLTACSHHNAAPVTVTPVPPGTVLTADDIQRSPGQSLEEMLIARVPGATMTRAPDGRMVLQLRGDNTIMGNAEALFVVNGIPLGPAVSGSLAGAQR